MEFWMWIVLALLAAAVFCWIMVFRKEKTFIYEPERGETPETLGLTEAAQPDLEPDAPAPRPRKSTKPRPKTPEPALFDDAASAGETPRSHDDTPETVRTSPTIGDAVEPPPDDQARETEPEHEGDQPMLYDAPSDGPRDNLSALKGLGPAMQSRLNRLGVYYFHQIAAWSDSEAEWVDAEIKGQGRILREDWPGQARKLMEPDQ